MTEKRYRMCTVCEATCGLVLEVEGREVRSIRGNPDDVFSRGYICPKGVALAELDADPDRLRQPLVRRDGTLVPATWEEAWAEIARGLAPIAAEHGANAVGVYIGNPTAHNTDLLLYYQALAQVFPSKSRFSAGTVDQIPKQLACALLYGDFITVPIPDIDRTQMLLMLGADPMESNGSLFTAPDFRGRVRALRERGGRLVVVDPRRSRSAELADHHLAIRPGTDAALLVAMAQVLWAEDLARPAALEEHLLGLEQVREAISAFTPERVAAWCGVEPDDIRSLARELATADSAAVYGRIGTTAQRFGTLASWAVDLLNILTGNLDRPGGAMFPKAAAFASNTRGEPGRGAGIQVHRWKTRVRGAPEVMGELPAAAMAEEIETPGEGQLRAMVTLAGNPVLSTPNGPRLASALDRLEFMVSVDLYLNETTRHADVVLPALSPLEHSHFDVLFPQFSVRNWARFSKPVFAAPEGHESEWKIVLRLAAILTGQAPDADLAPLDDLFARVQVQMATGDPHSPVHGRDVDEILAELAPRTGPERAVDLALRIGPYGDAFDPASKGLNLARLEADPNGVDLGALEPRLPEVLRTASGKIEIAHELLVGDLVRLDAALEETPPEFALIGRRQVRSNNTWMHNLPMLARGPYRCTLLVHPDDARRLGLADSEFARVSSRVGAVTASVEISDRMRPGVVSLPHGWGHDAPDTKQRVAAERPGVNANALTDEAELDPLSSTSVLNGVPVRIERVPGL